MNEDTHDINESMRHVENAALAHKAAVELAEERRLQLKAMGGQMQKLEIELAQVQRELDLIRIQAHDAQERSDKANEQNMELVERNGGLEACLRHAATIIADYYRNRQLNPVISPESRPSLGDLDPRRPGNASTFAQDARKSNGEGMDRPPRPEPSQPFQKG
jgi:hypothetical protein